MAGMNYSNDRIARALCESRDDAGLWDQIGDTYWREARRTEARRAWERARMLTPGSPGIRSKLTALASGLDPLRASA